MLFFCYVTNENVVFCVYFLLFLVIFSAFCWILLDICVALR